MSASIDFLFYAMTTRLAPIAAPLLWRRLPRLVLLMALFASFIAGDAAAQSPAKASGPNVSSGAPNAAEATKNLFNAVRKNDLAAVQSSITAGADIDAENSLGLTPAEVAVDNGNFEIAHFILSLRSIKHKPGSKPESPSGEIPERAPEGAPVETSILSAPSPSQLEPQAEAPKDQAPRAFGYGLIPIKPSSKPGAGKAAPVKDKAAQSPRAKAAPTVVPLKPAPKAAAAAPKAATSWPVGKPNPFDPDYVAQGSALPVIGKIHKQGQLPNEELVPAKGDLAPSAKGDMSPLQLTPLMDSANLPITEEDSKPAAKKGIMGRMLDIATFGLLKDGKEEPEPKVPAVKETASAPKPASPETAKLDEQSAMSATPSGAPNMPPTEPAEPAPEPAPAAPLEPAAAPKDASGEQKPAAPAKKGFLGRMLDIATFGLLKDDTKDLPAPKATETPVKEQKLAKAPPLTMPPPAKPQADGQPEQKAAAYPLEKKQSLASPPKSLLEPAKPNEESAKSGASWSVKDVQTATAPNLKTGPAQSLGKTSPENYLKGVELTLGQSVKLGSPLRLPDNQENKDKKVCIEKKSGSAVFCIKPVDWPQEIEPLVLVGTVFYTGLKTIVRYDEERATRFHSLFPAASYDQIVAYYKGRYGPPTEQLNRSIAPLASKRSENPIAAWRSINQVTQQITTLEIRKFDDTRGGFPDTERGAIMLYDQWSKPIFPQISTVELMLLRPNEVL